MNGVLVAVYNDHEAARRVRVVLIRDGFPTDRVDLTASDDLGRAGLGPAHSSYDKCVQYFRMLLRRPDERHYPEILARRLEDGAATITVSPTGRHRDCARQGNSAACSTGNGLRARPCEPGMFKLVRWDLERGEMPLLHSMSANTRARGCAARRVPRD